MSLNDTTFDVVMSNGLVLDNYRSITRATVSGVTGAQQVFRLFAWREGRCFDTTLPASTVQAVTIRGLGASNSPLVLPLFPAREYSRVSASKVERNFVEITPFAGYAGEDTSSRKIGFGGVYGGLQVLVAAFGDALGERITAALGAEALFEGSRLRIPVLAHLRYDLSGENKLVDSVRYLPNACAIRCPGDPPLPTPDTSFTEISTAGQKDSTVHLMRDRILPKSNYQPFVFAEGSLIFNTGFEGAGQEPSVNPEDYGQYFIGGGVGTVITGSWTASLGYRYMRLNLRTPCEGCVDRFIVNTNGIHSVNAKIGVHF